MNEYYCLGCRRHHKGEPAATRVSGKMTRMDCAESLKRIEAGRAAVTAPRTGGPLRKKGSALTPEQIERLVRDVE